MMMIIIIYNNNNNNNNNNNDNNDNNNIIMIILQPLNLLIRQVCITIFLMINKKNKRKKFGSLVKMF